MGDFNCLPGTDPYNVLVAEKPEKYATKFTDCIEGGKGIDWILYKGNVMVNHYEQVNFKVEGVYPSDHKPIFVEIDL
jgi:endonuclease/exonuclease/phosphatase family metal-dependent hydrolase